MKENKKFKNNFGVKSKSLHLIKAFAQECESLGWKERENGEIFSNYEGYYKIYLNGNEEGITTSPGHYNYNDAATGFIILENEWSKALNLASELGKQEPDLYTDEDLVYLDGKKEELFIGDSYFYVYENKGLGSNTRLSEAAIESYQQGYWKFFKTEKAAQDYITLQKAIKESGLKVGDEIDGKFSYENITHNIKGLGRFEDYTIDRFIIHNNIPSILTIYSKFSTQKFIIPISELSKNNLTFGGNEVTLNKHNETVLITCKGVTGTYDELKAIETSLSQSSDYLGKFGSVELKEYSIHGNSYNPVYLAALDTDTVKLGCSTGNMKEVRNILKECEVLLGK